MRLFSVLLLSLLVAACQPATEESNQPNTEATPAEKIMQPEAAVAERFVEGKDYRVLEQVIAPAAFEPQAGEAGYVIEFLWPGCPHCQEFNPTIVAFALEHPEVTVIKRAAPANERWAMDARVFFALREISETNLDDELLAFYQGVRVNHERLPTQPDLNRFMAEHGIAEDAFAAAYEDPALTDKLRVVLEDMRGANISSVPTVVVNGRYVVEAPAPHSQAESQRYFALINHLLTL